MSKCAVCKRDPQRMNGPMSECSHVECPTRERAWSQGTKQYRPSKTQAKEGDTTRPIGTVEWRNADRIGEHDDNP